MKISNNNPGAIRPSSPGDPPGKGAAATGAGFSVAPERASAGALSGVASRYTAADLQDAGKADAAVRDSLRALVSEQPVAGGLGARASGKTIGFHAGRPVDPGKDHLVFTEIPFLDEVELQLFVSQAAGEPPKLYSFPEPARIVLGRGPDSPVPMDGPAVSREHLAFEVRDGRVFVSDLSSNGSFLNGQRLKRDDPQRIIEEDEVRAAGYSFAFRLISDEPPPPPKADPKKSASEPAAKAQPAPGGAAEPPVPEKKRRRFRLSALEWIVLLLAGASIALIVLYVLS